MNANIIERVREKVIGNGEEITFDDAVALASTDFGNLPALMSLSNAVTSMYHERGVYLCSITSGRTGACPEDCRFCAQSIYSETPVPPRTVIDPREILESARRAEAGGASEFCIVISGRGPNKHVFERVLESVRLIREYTDMSIGCSLGILTQEQAKLLSTAGVRRYNHNLETSRSFFPRVCTTHAYDDRIGTARLVKENGIRLCCGGIIGLGETAEDRVSMAYELKELGPEVVPLNFLNPRPGTGMGKMETLHPFEAIKAVSLFRIILPKSILLCAGGREAGLGEYQPCALFAGANALISGDYLTTKGDPMDKDTGMIRGLGLPVLRYS